MKTLLFIVLKVLEVVAMFIIVGLLGYCVGYFKFMEWLSNYSEILFYVYNIGAILYGAYYLTSRGVFKDWFSTNKKWVDKIIK